MDRILTQLRESLTSSFSHHCRTLVHSTAGIRSTRTTLDHPQANGSTFLEQCLTASWRSYFVMRPAALRTIEVQPACLRRGAQLADPPARPLAGVASEEPLPVPDHRVGRREAEHTKTAVCSSRRFRRSGPWRHGHLLLAARHRCVIRHADVPDEVCYLDRLAACHGSVCGNAG